MTPFIDPATGLPYTRIAFKHGYKRSWKYFLLVVGFLSFSLLFFSWLTFEFIHTIATFNADLAADAGGIEVPDADVPGPFMLFTICCAIAFILFADIDQKPPRPRLAKALGVGFFGSLAIMIPAKIMITSHYQTLATEHGYVACTRPRDRTALIYAKVLEDCIDIREEKTGYRPRSWP